MISGLLAGLSMQTAVQSGVNVPELDQEFRAVWVATVANIDWPSRRKLTVPQMKTEMLDILEQCEEMNINAVVFQVRPTADAFYQSDLEPWSFFMSGYSGVAPGDGFDPLQYTIDEAHKRGIEVHAWCNPFRAHTASQGNPIMMNRIHAHLPRHALKNYGSDMWLDPGEPDAQDHSFDVFMDIVSRYDIDGLHIDDYFYPYPVYENGNRVEFPDHFSYGKYLAAGGPLSRDDWRRDNINRFVERVYDGIKAVKPTVKFGISPFGIYRPGIPAGINGFDQYAQIYADARKWLREGWCDYWSPQLYWPIEQSGQAYPVLLDYWVSENWQGRHVWPGNFTSRTNPSNGNWPVTEISEQIQITRDTPGATGNVHFSMNAFYRDYNGIATHLENGIYSTPAVVPPSPWLDGVAPGQPEIQVLGSWPNFTVLVTDPGASDVRFFVLQTSEGEVQTSSESVFTLQNPNASWVSVKALDKASNQSPPAVLEAPF